MGLGIKFLSTSYLIMVTFRHLVILQLAFLNSSMVICSYGPGHGDHHHSHPGQQDTTYDVMKFGAVGDGKTDDYKAFMSAWIATCKNTINNPKIIVPGGKTFLLSAVEFTGPCKSPYITFEIYGNIIAPPKYAWKNKTLDEWIYFFRVDGLTVDGHGYGLIDGQGDSWWKYGEESHRPTALRFSQCNRLQLRGLKHINSQMNHVSITNCSYANIGNLHMTAPKKSPNTDGIDISYSSNVNITNSIMATGDDCIAINGGTYNVIVFNITCGPGHGISIGSLGERGTHEEVESIHVSNCTFNGTDNGVRIKTWQGGSGFARDITFSNIVFIQADNPVIIDQFYCPHKTCANQTSGVKVSDIKYIGLHGTTTCRNATVRLLCSETVPCTRIELIDVNIAGVSWTNPVTSQCINAHGVAHNCLNPAVNCLET